MWLSSNHTVGLFVSSSNNTSKFEGSKHCHRFLLCIVSCFQGQRKIAPKESKKTKNADINQCPSSSPRDSLQIEKITSPGPDEELLGLDVPICAKPVRGLQPNTFVHVSDSEWLAKPKVSGQARVVPFLFVQPCTAHDPPMEHTCTDVPGPQQGA